MSPHNSHGRKPKRKAISTVSTLDRTGDGWPPVSPGFARRTLSLAEFFKQGSSQSNRMAVSESIVGIVDGSGRRKEHSTTTYSSDVAC
ncbi:hypothetical protein AArcMg_2543 [Natrarchaeobaculum sulfurireducens]|uniref:Uncharacterized protein n=1 Tax=Natrarchaeobaculum sulfurireducens TaxID=2044521 RepID=A0A346PSN9_9EURY|nr:hypothetical protein AArcMg_2543 [Natrarchaeobaculum sulfurireducens]